MYAVLGLELGLALLIADKHTHYERNISMMVMMNSMMIMKMT